MEMFSSWLHGFSVFWQVVIVCGFACISYGLAIFFGWLASFHIEDEISIAARMYYKSNKKQK